MSLTAAEAAIILGVKPEDIERFQREQKMPDPIPDDYLDHFVEFRIRLQRALQAKVDRTNVTED